MPDNWQPAPPVAPGGLPQHFAEVVAFEAERKKRIVRDNRIAWKLVAALAVANIGQIAVIAGMQPLVRVVPYLIIDRGNGSWDAAASMSDLSPTQQKALIESALWTYVRDREGYNFAGAPDAYAVVSAMSAPPFARLTSNGSYRARTARKRSSGKRVRSTQRSAGSLSCATGWRWSATGVRK
jgi:type IV secretory pathway component VirB8